ncbi:MAG TPA: hypothetical protein VJ866_06020 [Pyrinomonadaceae bacterium]|nr:hypothetical protein [Pyrinomonadaceae bacterium]
MNCRDFNNVVNELADGRLMEAAAREAGLGHASECVDCAAQLMDARGTSAALHIAARADVEEAPARVKETLLNAFAERLRESMEQPAPVAERPPVVVELPARRALRRWDAATVAAAAAVLLILGSAYLLRESRRASQPSQMEAALPAPAVSPENVVGPETPDKNKGASVPTIPQDASTNAAANPPIKRTTPLAHKAPRVENVAAKLKSETAARNSAGSMRKGAGSNGGEYLPLTYLAGATAMESGTVVRVEMSRAALISLGVPLSAERTDETFKADVVIGDDGVARAIRLVGND